MTSESNQLLKDTGFLHSVSSGILPHKPHGLLSLFRNGLWLAQVPANSPSFLAQILIAIPAKAKDSRTKVIIKSSMNII
tara:strand:- start:1689 stop:1925 length:237 start_codon:yes stop_codon:yes gene_type:complete